MVSGLFRMAGWAGLWLGSVAAALAQQGDMSRLDTLVPKNCLYYSGWNPGVTLDPASGNHAEALLSEPEVQAFLGDLSRNAERLIPALIPASRDGRDRIARRAAPELAKILFSRPGCLYLEKLDLSADGGTPLIEGALIVDAGGSARSLFEDLAKLVPGEVVAETTRPGAAEGIRLIRVAVPDPTAPAIHLGTMGELLFATVGEASAQWLQGTPDATGAPGWLTRLRERNPLQKPASWGWIDLAGLREVLLEEAPPEAGTLARELGLDGLASVESVGGFDAEGLASRARVELNGPPRGLLALCGDRGISAADLQHIPSDALFAAGWSIDAARVLELVESLVAKFDPGALDDFSGGLDSIEGALGIDVQQDLIGALGTTWTLYNGAGDGLISGLTLTVSVRDPGSLKRTLGQMEPALQSALARDRDAPKLVRRNMEGTDVWSLQFQGMPVPFEPSWCLAGDQLVVTLFPQGMAPFLKKLTHVPLVDETAYSRFANQFSGAGEAKLLAFGYTDTRRQFELAYPWAQMMLTMIQGMSDEMELPPELDNAVRGGLRGISLPSARSIYPHLRPAISAFRQTGSGFELESSQTLPMLDVTVAAPVLVGMLLPAVQQVREAARQAESMNNLKQLALAAHWHESIHGRLPAAWTSSPEGKPLLSWRVQLLPYLEQQQLYDSFHHDEPWDSPHNIQLLERMPAVFRSPNSTAAPGMTNYIGVGGARGILGAGPEDGERPAGKKLGQIPDGLSNTIMIVEASDTLAVPWTQPDRGFDPGDGEFWNLFGMRPGGLIAAFGDGSVRFLSNSIDWDQLRHGMTIDDGNPVFFDD